MIMMSLMILIMMMMMTRRSNIHLRQRWLRKNLVNSRPLKLFDSLIFAPRTFALGSELGGILWRR